MRKQYCLKNSFFIPDGPIWSMALTCSHIELGFQISDSFDSLKATGYWHSLGVKFIAKK